MKTTIVIIAFILAFIAASLSLAAQQYSYDAAGRLTKVIYSNGLETRYTYDKNGNITNAKTDIINGVDEGTTQTLSLTASPNPANERVVLGMKDLEGERADINVVSSSGEVVLRVSRVIQNGECTIDTRALASGVYNIQCSCSKLKGSLQITIVR